MRKLFFLPLLMLLTSCATPMSYYDNTSPQLKLEEFYNGPLVAYGMVQDRKGRVIRRFKVDMQGHWQGNKGRLEEWFEYDDGEKQQRTWHLEKLGEGHYRGNASDVTRSADGYSNGFALNWFYTLRLKVEGREWDIDFNDWMYLVGEKRILNRAEMKKWGFRVGEVILYIEKLGEASAS